MGVVKKSYPLDNKSLRIINRLKLYMGRNNIIDGVEKLIENDIFL